MLVLLWLVVRLVAVQVSLLEPFLDILLEIDDLVFLWV
jgi:hypothetical protein